MKEITFIYFNYESQKIDIILLRYLINYNKFQMNCFQTITQFIDIDDNEYNKKKYNKNACHFFALKTAYEFMKKKEGSKTTHEANIYFAINMNKLYQNHDMYFEEVVKFTDLKQSDISATTTELIKNGDYPLDLIFPVDNNNSYCVIILKNAKYFNVMRHGDNFYVRDCHEPFQYDFSSRKEMIKHLNKTYQFNESLILDGYAIPEFSSIEYIIINNPFNFKNGILEDGVSSDNKESDPKNKVEQLKETEFGISIGHINYDDAGGDSVITDKNIINNNQNNNNNIIKNKPTIFSGNIVKLTDIDKKIIDHYIKDSKYDEDEFLNDDKIDKDSEHIDDTENDEEIGGEILIPATTH